MSARRIELVEVSPRDGLQNEPDILSTEVKLELIRRAVAAGVRRLEAASFVNPKRVPQMADAEAVMAGLPRDDGVTYIGLGAEPARFRPRGASRLPGGQLRAGRERCVLRTQPGNHHRAGHPRPRRHRRRRPHRKHPAERDDQRRLRLPFPGPGRAGAGARADRPLRRSRPVRDRDRRHHRGGRARRGRRDVRRSRPARARGAACAGIFTTRGTPGSPTPSPPPRQGCMRSMRASAASAAVRSRRRRPETSRRRTWSTCSTGWAWRPVSTSRR